MAPIRLRRTLTTDSQTSHDLSRTEGHGTRARIRLLALLVLTVFFAGTVLFIKLKLEDLRAVFEVEAERRTGVDLGIGTVRVNGLKGLIIEDFHTSLPVPGGPSVEISAPETYIYINVVDLFYGQVTIDRVQLDRAEILVNRDPGNPWFVPDKAAPPPLPTSETNVPPPGAPVEPAAPPEATTGLKSALAFRILGRDCTLRVNNVVATTGLELSSLEFDALRLTDSTDYSVKLAGLLGGDEAKKLSLNVRFASLEDFDFRMQSGLVTADELNVFLPAQQQFVQAGSASASVRVAGYPGRTMVVSMDMPFAGLQLRNQPPLLQPLTGSLTALGEYNLDSRTLTLTTAQAKSEQLGGRLEGSVSFVGEHPALDLHLHAAQLPVKDALQYALDLAGQSLEGLEVELKEPYAIDVAMQGTTAEPVIVASAALSEGRVAYRPKAKGQPQVDLTFGQVNLAWDSRTVAPTGSLTVRDGTAEEPTTGLKAQKIMGTLTLTSTGVVLDPLNAEVRGNPIVGRAEYSNESKEVTFTANGTIANLENTPLGSGIKDVQLGGSLAVRCNGKVSKNHQTFDLAVDGTQAAVGFEWWFRKPPGIGLTLNGVNVDVTPGKSIKVVGQAMLDTVPISATIELRGQKSGYALETIRAKADTVDPTTADKVLNTRYRLAGGGAKNLTLDWNRTNKGPNTKKFVIAGHLDEVFATPKIAKLPIIARDADIEVAIEDGEPGNKTGVVTLNAKSGGLPPMGETWFVPIEPDDPELMAQFKEEGGPRMWRYTIHVQDMQLLPWQATEFHCEGTSGDSVTEISSFTGKVGDGTLSGSYRVEQKDNIGRLKAEWNKVPAVYLLRHLKFPEVLSGSATGNVDYTMDNDDPGTLKGKGKVAIQDGQFSFEAIQQQFKDQLASGIPSMPSSKFSELSMDIEIEGDKITTNNVALAADGITVTGNGTYVTEGDMNYTLNVAIAPATAERIPVLRDYFNIEGHRLTQNNIELAFNVNGPAFNPTGQVAGLPPVGITLISGAAELTSEALKVIDLPRQILLDLFKIGGAVAGPPKQ